MSRRGHINFLYAHVELTSRVISHSNFAAIAYSITCKCTSKFLVLIVDGDASTVLRSTVEQGFRAIRKPYIRVISGRATGRRTTVFFTSPLR
jgi:hypothetical protein